MFSRLTARAASTFRRAASTARPIRFKTAGALATAAFVGGVTHDHFTQAAPKVDYAKVKAVIADSLDREGHDDGSIGPILVRLAWHASGTFDKADGSGGSDRASMRFSPEADHGANAGLQKARNFLEPIKAQFPDISYADLWVLAGYTAIEEMGGAPMKFQGGRTDCKDASGCTPDGRLPDAAQGASHLRDIFYRQGFNDQEIVALSGAHALGRCHEDRSGFSGPWTRAPTTVSNEYFRLLLEDTWEVKQWDGPKQYENSKSGKDLMMLPTDISLINDPSFRKWVEIYKDDEERFLKDFGAAFVKLTENGTNVGKKSVDGKVLGVAFSALVGLTTIYGASLK